MHCLEVTEVYVKRDGKVYYIKFEKGVPTVELKEIGEATETGTRSDSKQIQKFSKNLQSMNTIFWLIVLRELAYLNRNLRVTITDERSEEHSNRHLSLRRRH